METERQRSSIARAESGQFKPYSFLTSSEDKKLAIICHNSSGTSATLCRVCIDIDTYMSWKIRVVLHKGEHRVLNSVTCDINHSFDRAITF